MNKIKFSKDGWQAIINESFTYENVKVTASALSDYVVSKGIEAVTASKE